MMRKLGKEDVDDWFENKPLFICEHYETDNVMAIIQKIDTKIDALGIEVLYLPNLECSLINCPAKLQLDILDYLKELAFEKQICIIATISPYSISLENKGIFNTQHKIDEESFNGIIPKESIHNVVSTDNKTATIESWDYWDYYVDAPKTVMIRSTDGFYTFDSITSFIDEFSNDLPF